MLRRDSLYCLQQRRLTTAHNAFNAVRYQELRRHGRGAVFLVTSGLPLGTFETWRWMQKMSAYRGRTGLSRERVKKALFTLSGLSLVDHIVASSSGGIALTISAEIPNSSTRICARSARVISRFLTTLSAEISVRVRRPTLRIRSEK
jgi:hypothetical protein